MKYIFLLLFCVGSANASYVDILIKVNKVAAEEKKIPGVTEDDVQANLVIPHFVKNMQEYISAKNEPSRVHYKSVQNILVTYKACDGESQKFPLKQNYRNCDKAKVDYFLEQICQNFEDDYWIKESAFFNLFYYVLKKNRADVEIAELTSENKKLVLENINYCSEKLQMNANYLDQICELNAKILRIQQQNVSQLSWFNDKNKAENTLKSREEEYNEREKIWEKELSEARQKITSLTSNLRAKNLLVNQAEDQIKLLRTSTNSLMANHEIFKCLSIIFSCTTLYFGYAYYTR